ncbi:hypothetical protein M405DRAFT_811405 [Rhizopogon salebrosus TDB-379]|nr:hypothetical protein M405DRAFT_811405 [Rhizopogon salebrosus TDB-379]
MEMISGVKFQTSNLNFGASCSQRSRRLQGEYPRTSIICPSSNPHPPVNSGPRMNW